jgi:putative membrane protein
MKRLQPVVVLLAACALILAWSAVGAKDCAVWLFEVSIGATGIVVLAAVSGRFRFSTLVYLLAGIHFAVLAAGGKYTYADMPVGDWLRDALGLARNPYDRIGHFMQGFVPALITREVLLRATPLKRGWILNVLVVSFCLAFSAFYELIEWQIVIWFYPHAGPEWLGMQGDPWDAQQDMLMALTGATLSLIALSRAHDRSMAALPDAGATGR